MAKGKFINWLNNLQTTKYVQWIRRLLDLVVSWKLSHDLRVSRDIVKTIFVELADDFNNFSKYLQQKKIGVRFKIK